ncbi:MAG: ComF family protein [Pirellulales bacterium]|nr:ComF family protein [Pirellulales bacterium]
MLPRGLALAWTALLDLVYPPACVVCGTDSAGGVCAGCRGQLVPRAEPRCPRCAGRLGAQPPRPEGCAFCGHVRFSFDAVFTLGQDEGALRIAIRRIKRAGHEPLALALGDLLVEQVGPLLAEWRPDLVVPVPMHWLRRLLRGVNGPELVAERLAQRLGLDYEARVVRRPRYSRPQGSLPPGERRKNVRRALALGKGYDVRGMRVLLVDDIMTTGTTVNTAARLLKRAGAAAVAVVVLARAQGG